MLNCAVVAAEAGARGVGGAVIHAGGGSPAHGVGGFVTGPGDADLSCIRSNAQPPNPTASATIVVAARSTAARPHVRPHDWRWITSVSFSDDHAKSGAASVSGARSWSGRCRQRSSRVDRHRRPCRSPDDHLGVVASVASRRDLRGSVVERGGVSADAGHVVGIARHRRVRGDVVGASPAPCDIPAAVSG
jgi:hypothetical protein